MFCQLWSVDWGSGGVMKKLTNIQRIVLTSLSLATLPSLAGNVISGNPIVIAGLYCVGKPWTGGVVPYTVSVNSNPQILAMIEDALQTYAMRTNVKFAPRTGEENYLSFKFDPTMAPSAHAHSDCYGMQGKQQFIRINPANTQELNAVILEHELGHALGLFHEHQRVDRGAYIDVLIENIRAFYASYGVTDPTSFLIKLLGNYGNSNIGSKPFGPYDYDSIMHYPEYIPLSDGTLVQIFRSKTGIPIHGESSLSAGDIAAINSLYPSDSRGLSFLAK